MTVQVETKSASLETFAVTIRALHVGGKQMTQAVFRQLPVRASYTRDGYIVPMDRWGLVMYRIKDEADEWVVASIGGVLYKCPLAWTGSSKGSAEYSLRRAQKELDWWSAGKIKIDAGVPTYLIPRSPARREQWSEEVFRTLPFTPWRGQLGFFDVPLTMDQLAAGPVAA